MDSDNTLIRRDFLGNSSAAAIVGAATLNGVPGKLLAGTGAGGRLEGAHFEDLIGETFRVNGQVPLKLLDAKVGQPRDTRPSYTRDKPFSLLFSAPEGTELSDQIHQVSHGEIGSFDLFVQRVQMESHPNGNTYEIVFS